MPEKRGDDEMAEEREDEYVPIAERRAREAARRAAKLRAIGSKRGANAAAIEEAAAQHRCVFCTRRRRLLICELT